MNTERLPLFPVEIVLFPGMPLPLHIFEPRYKVMIRRCRQDQQEFGVLLAAEKGVAEVGCTAEIVKVVKEYEDGRMDILTLGQSRFRLRETFQEQPYWEGRVDFLPDQDDLPGDAAAAARLRESYEQVFRLLHGRAPEPLAEARAGGLSYRLAAELPLPLEYKQQLLELVSEAERQQNLAEQLEAWLPQLEQLDRTRKQARGNGRGR